MDAIITLRNGEKHTYNTATDVSTDADRVTVRYEVPDWGPSWGERMRRTPPEPTVPDVARYPIADVVGIQTGAYLEDAHRPTPVHIVSAETMKAKDETIRSLRARNQGYLMDATREAQRMRRLLDAVSDALATLESGHRRKAKLVAVERTLREARSAVLLDNYGPSWSSRCRRASL